MKPAAHHLRSTPGGLTDALSTPLARGRPAPRSLGVDEPCPGGGSPRLRGGRSVASLHAHARGCLAVELAAVRPPSRASDAARGPASSAASADARYGLRRD